MDQIKLSDSVNTITVSQDTYNQRRFDKDKGYWFVVIRRFKQPRAGLPKVWMDVNFYFNDASI